MRHTPIFSRLTIYLVALFTLSVAFPLVSFAGVSGFTTTSIAFDKSSIIEGEELSLSIGFTNQEDKRLTGKITFYNKDQILGSRELNLDAGQSGEFILPWVASLGEHSFTAKAEQLKLEGSSVTILGPETEPKELVVGYKNSSMREQLRTKGTLGAMASGFLEEAEDFFVPIIQSIDAWRISKIDPFSQTKIRIDGDKKDSEGKMKPLLVVHSILLTGLIFVFSKKVVFFVLFSLLLIWVIIRIIKLFRYIIRRRYDQE